MPDKNQPADPPVSLIAFAINERAMDDWGPDRLNAAQRRDLMEIVEDRYEVGSTPPLVDCSNRLSGKGSPANYLSTHGMTSLASPPSPPLGDCFAIICRAMDAILDRLVHNAYRVDLDGQSMRKTKLKTDDESTQN